MVGELVGSEDGCDVGEGVGSSVGVDVVGNKVGANSKKKKNCIKLIGKNILNCIKLIA